MRYGICTNTDNLKLVADAGFDYIEPALTELAALSEDQFQILVKKIQSSSIKAEVFNVFFPGTIHLTGSDVQRNSIQEHAKKALTRAALLGCKTVVLGSGGSRKIPEGFPVEEAKEQFKDALTIAGEIASSLGITIVLEPLNTTETNLVNSVLEGLQTVKEVNHTNVKLLADFYHIQKENQSLSDILKCTGYLEHIHIANSHGRVYPLSQNEDQYKEFFEHLVQVGYNGRISIEGSTNNMIEDAPKALKMMKILEEKIMGNQVLGGGGFHHVALKVKDLDATVAIYKKVLGCVEVAAWGEGSGRGIMLDTGDGACFEIFAGGTGLPANGFYHVALRTTKLDEVMAGVREAGLTVTMEPTDITISSTPPMPARIAFFNGLDGESIELFQNR